MKLNNAWTAFLIDFQPESISRGHVCRERVLLAVLGILTVIYLAQAVVINMGG